MLLPRAARNRRALIVLLSPHALVRLRRTSHGPPTPPGGSCLPLISHPTERFDDSWYGWNNALAVLGIERFQPAYAATGMPLALAERPEPLTTVFARILQEALDDHGDRRDGVVWRGEELWSRLDDALEQVAAIYGEDQARALIAWERRIFLDLDAVQVWRRWDSSFFGHALNVEYGSRYPSAPLPFDAERNERVHRSIIDRLGEPALARIQQLIGEVAAVEPSNLEFAFARSSDNRGRVGSTLSRPRMPTYALIGALHDNRTCQIWDELDGWLTEAERQTLLLWGRAQESARWSHSESDNPRPRSTLLWLPERVVWPSEG